MREKKSSPSWPPPLGIDKVHVIFYIAGLIVAIIGYKLSAIAPWDSPLSRTVAPLVLLLAYLVIFPLAILWKSKRDK